MNGSALKYVWVCTSINVSLHKADSNAEVEWIGPYVGKKCGAHSDLLVQYILPLELARTQTHQNFPEQGWLGLRLTIIFLNQTQTHKNFTDLDSLRLRLTSRYESEWVGASRLMSQFSDLWCLHNFCIL